MNQQFDRSPGAAAQTDTDVVSRAMASVYWWMSLGLAVTGVIAFGVAHSETLAGIILGTPGVFIGLMIAELVLVIALSAAISKMSPAVAAGVFLLYAALNGATMSAIFLVYTQGSIATTFFVTGGTFGAMAAYGTITKRDLTGWGSFLFMGLIGVVIASVVNMFLHSEMLYWAITFAGILVFVGLTAYDVQRIRRAVVSGALPHDKLAVYGALMLYLDFINLFLLLLRLFGRRR